MSFIVAYGLKIAFCKILPKGTTSFFAGCVGGGGVIDINILLILYFHFVLKYRLLLSICGLHFWCPSNLKMLPTRLMRKLCYVSP